MIMEEGAQKQFNAKELDNKVTSSSNELYPTITEEGAQKHFDPAESDNEEVIVSSHQILENKKFPAGDLLFQQHDVI